MTKDEILNKLKKIFAKHLGATSKQTEELVSTIDGKLYEAYILSEVTEKLVNEEGFSLSLVHGNKIKLKSSPGPINRNYPYIQVFKDQEKVAEIWTDVEFLSLSYSRVVDDDGKPSRKPTRGEYHELDIVVIEPEQHGRPAHDKIWLGIECKHTSYQKHLLKEILGVRRELSLLYPQEKTQFTKWPRAFVPAMPASCLVVFSTDPDVVDFSEPGKLFGIDFVHHPM